VTKWLIPARTLPDIEFLPDNVAWKIWEIYISDRSNSSSIPPAEQEVLGTSTSPSAKHEEVLRLAPCENLPSGPEWPLKWDLFTADTVSFLHVETMVQIFVYVYTRDSSSRIWITPYVDTIQRSHSIKVVDTPHHSSFKSSSASGAAALAACAFIAPTKSSSPPPPRTPSRRPAKEEVEEEDIARIRTYG